MDELKKQRLEAHLVVGGMAHDFDFARIQLLKILSEDERIRTKVSSTWEEFNGDSDTVLITYSCNLKPSDEAAIRLRDFVDSGGRWIALHATNSLLSWGEDGVNCAPPEGPFLDTLGSAFQGHPPIGEFKVSSAGSNHPLVEGIQSFDVVDELYLSDFSTPVEVLLSTRFGGEVPGFMKSHWDEDERPVMYIRKLGKGEVLYLTLGHARGHYDAPHRTPYFPEVERGAWDIPEFYELLRRSIKWGFEPQLSKELA